MMQIALPIALHNRRVHSGHGDFVHPAFWGAAGLAIAAIVLRVPLDTPSATAAATALFMIGGLPHGAYDIALLRRATALDRSGLMLAAGGYVTAAVLMAMLWATVPLIALPLFLVVAAVHFGEDWDVLDEPLLRFAAGSAMIAAPTIAHPADVAALFVAMSDPRTAVIAQIVVAAAPVTLLVASVAIAVAWRDGSRVRAFATALCLVLLLVLPPVAGFALFFVFLHSPLHLAQTRTLLRDMTNARWLGTGALLSGAAIVGWWAMQPLTQSIADADLTAQAFQLLAALTVPHLVLSHWLEKRLGRPQPSLSLRPNTGISLP